MTTQTGMLSYGSPVFNFMSQDHHLVGFHASAAGGLHKAIAEADAFECEVAQVFTKNNLQWNAKPFTEVALEKYHEAKAASALKHIFGHSGYLINLAATNPETLQKSRDSLIVELDRSQELGLPFLVLHPGAAKERTREEGLEKIIESLEWVFERTDSQTKIALESTAGAGTILGRTTEELAFLIDNTPSSERLAICLDTCHLFAAGYKLNTAAELEDYLSEFKKLIDWERVVCLHMNDSKGECGKNLDRHEILGDGQIGWELFATIMKHPDFANMPLCLETPPGDDRCNDVETLKRLKATR